jgi:hypothetical protein
VHATGKVGPRLLAASVNTILKKLAQRAAPTLRRRGIDPEGVSGHSCRVGMAQDLAAAGFDVVAIMPAGRWRSPEMVARYAERLQARRGAVAQYYRELAGRLGRPCGVPPAALNGPLAGRSSGLPRRR